MKNIRSISICIMLLGLSIISNSQIIPTQGFESGTIPLGWNEEIVSGSRSWRFQDGGYSNSGYKYPAHAYAGSFNALFENESYDAITKLITKTVDLHTAIKPVLTFWHAQYEWGDGQNDNLNVYYRISDDASKPWVLIQSYTLNLESWTYHEIILPDAAKVAKCQIAFEGVSNWGFGVCLDDITLVERGILERRVDAIKLFQKNQVIASGSTSNSLGYIEIDVKGNTGNLPLNSLLANYTGTNIDDLNPSGFELFYTSDTVFSPKTKINATISKAGNIITFSNINYNLQTGENYFWVCATVKDFLGTHGSHGNIADFKLDQNSVNVGGILFPSSILSPQEFSTIEESVFYDSFETNLGWTFSPTSCWQIGIVPATVGTNDPNQAFSGQRILATNLSGNYPSLISDPQTATTPSINCKYYQNINIRFKRWLNFDFFDKTAIKISTDGGSTWTKIMENIRYYFDQSWNNVSFNISQYATRKQNVNVMFSIESSDGTTEFGGWNVDNFAVTGDYIAKDLGVKSIVTPISHCGMGAEEVKIVIKNYGGDAVSGPFDVGFSLDNGITYTKETVNQTINSEAEYTYTFTLPANLSQPGLKNLAFKTFLVGDEDASNDKYSTSLFVYPTQLYTYQNSFETSNGYWNPSGTNSSWAWGIPDGPSVIKSASDGTKAWVTNLKGNHNNSEVSYLESPCFDFRTAQYPVVAFDYLVNAEDGVDGFRLEYSVDGGNSWLVVPENTNHSQNWCTGTTVTALASEGWTGVTSTTYTTAKTLLPISGINKVTGINGVKFRFKFASNSTTSYEGVAIDNIKIYELPYDVRIQSLTSPLTCLIVGSVHLQAVVENLGYRPLKTGLNVPIEIKVRNENVITESLTIPSDIPQGGTTTFTSTGTYNFLTKGAHALKINTKLTPELNTLNDTLTTTLNAYTLGLDKAVPNTPPISVLLDAGAGYVSYLWVSTPPLPPLTSPANQNSSITAVDFGTYSVTVENADGCKITDAIDVIPSTNDIELSYVSGLSDACGYPSPVKPTIKIKNLGPGKILSGAGIPLSIMIDGVDVVKDEIYTLSGDINKDASVDYTFTTGIDLSTAKTYGITIHSDINDDPDKNNNTFSVTTHVWGLPDVNFPQDTIVSLNATSITLDAGVGFATYVWKNSSVTTHDFTIPSLNSAWYSVTVTNMHSCGIDKDSVFINAKDLSVVNIESPTPIFCDNKNLHVKLLVSNTGRDNFSSGEVIHASYITPSESISQDFSLPSTLTPGSTKILTFDNPVNFSASEGFIRATAIIIDDPTKSNNTFERSFEKHQSPTVSFNPSTLNKIFDSQVYTISPTYSSNVQSYAWKCPDWFNNVSYSPTYSITNTPPGRVLHVFAYENASQSGCRDSATLTINSDDLAITAIKTPINKCALEDNTPVTITLKNTGNFDYPVGTSITISMSVDGVASPDQILLLDDILPSGIEKDVLLDNKVQLALKSTATIQVSISTSLDVVSTNNLLNKTVYATGYPTVDLGADRAVHKWSEKLKPGNIYDNYEWKLNSSLIPAPEGIDSTLTVTQSGTYKVTVTDFNGCPGSDEVTLTFVVDDISLKSLDTPITECGMVASEPVKVTIENTGTETILSGKQIEIGFTQNGATKKQNINLGSDLLSGQTRAIDLTGTMDFTIDNEYKRYPIKVWAIMAEDMRSNNDTLSTYVDVLPSELFSLGSNIVSETPVTLDPGLFASSTYLWSTGATTQSIIVGTTGDYWVEVTNSYGCKTKSNVHVKIGTRDISVESLVAPITSCTLSSNETITVRLTNTGTNVIPNTTLIPINLKVDGLLVATENCTLTSDLAIGGGINYSFNYKHNFSNPKTYLLEINTSLSDDEVSSNNTLYTSITVKGNPMPNLGPDRNINSTTILDAGAGYTNYTWQDGSHDQTFTVNASGTYSVTVTDANGCSGSDAVVLTWEDLSDVRVTALLSPATNCYKTQGQTVTATLTNSGSKTFTTADNISVSYQIGSNTPVVETMNFSSNFANGQSTNYTFTQKAILSPGAVSMVLKTIISGIDGIASSPFPITINANPVFNLGNDTIKTTLPYVLTSNISGVSYSWNTGSTNGSITVSSYGKYWLTVTNSNSCTAADTVVIAQPGNDVEIIPGSNAKVTLFPNPVNDELTIKIETDKNEVFNIDLINPNGQIVKNLKTDKTFLYSNKIDVKGYTPGMYLIRVSNDKGFAAFKIVVQR